MAGLFYGHCPKKSPTGLPTGRAFLKASILVQDPAEQPLSGA